MLPTVKGVIGDAKTYPKKLPEVATFNYQSAHKVNFSKALEETNWKEELGPKKKNNFMAPFYGWGSTTSRLEPLRGGSLLLTSCQCKEFQ